MARFLVSGMPALVSDVSAALGAQGAEVAAVEDVDDVPRVCAEAGASAFDGYVQLPASFTVEGDTAGARVHHFFADGVLARFPAVAAALPALRPQARITFVTGVLPEDVSTEDDVAARAALVRVLGRAAQADAANGLRICTLGSGATAEEIALTALGRNPDLGSFTTGPDDSYSEWRIELLGMMWAET